jgi:hypothetical protein
MSILDHNWTFWAIKDQLKFDLVETWPFFSQDLMVELDQMYKFGQI